MTKCEDASLRANKIDKFNFLASPEGIPEQYRYSPASSEGIPEEYRCSLA
jgi:hypothetical protein